MMTFESLIPIFKSNHIYPSTQETITDKGKKVTGLVVCCPSIILMQDNVERISEVLKQEGIAGFKVYGLPNKGEIYIEKS